ncbi:hypothetical protein GJAV_G00228350 [Gymnothorax javanicus]|nr:hypothetical protein GJAV_G00228350 [Gymnothorax javanicus]
MHLSNTLLLALLIYSAPGVHGGNILVFPLDGSHWEIMKVLTEELFSRGHNITVVRASNSVYIKETSPHYTSITIPKSGGFVEEDFGSFVLRVLQHHREGDSFWTRKRVEIEVANKLSEIYKDTLDMTARMFDDEKLMQSLMDAKYDLVLTDPGIGSGVFLAHRLRLPLVLSVKWTIHGDGHYAIAPSPLSFVPFAGTELTDKMNFNERVKNMMAYAFGSWLIARTRQTHYTEFCRRYFGAEVDYFSLFQAADIWLMRVDFVFEFPRPTMPNVVYVGGFQCRPAKPLPQDLEEFVQSSGEHGVVIMSLGTFVRHLPHDVAEEIAAAFAKLPQKIIWKHTGEKPKNLGNNTLLVEWMPQNDLLGHPKTRAFVAHGGTNGVQEAIFHGVPIVGVPLMFDQFDNLYRMKARGAANIVSIATLDRTTFFQALQEVIHEPSYRGNMQRLSRLHRDQPMKPLDRAMFWIEFVIRHKGAAHLRTESYRMPCFSPDRPPRC